MKRMKIIRQDDFKEHELAVYRPIAYMNIAESATQVVIYMKQIGEDERIARRGCVVTPIGLCPTL